jgi:fatty acid desaturase
MAAPSTGYRKPVSLLPPRDGDARELLRYSRRMEILGAVAALIGAAVTWSGEWWTWLLVGVGLLGLSPWPGPAAILRRAEKNPDILVDDPQRRRERARRLVTILVPAYTLLFTLAGYLLLGWGGALFFLVLGALSSGIGAWLVLRR